jgi:malate dehydrogenase
MLTVAILGAGEVGAACARALAAGDRVHRIVLIDDTAAAGKALDIQQSGAIDLFHTRLSGTADLSAAIEADICVMADRAGNPARESTAEDQYSLFRRLALLASRAPVIWAGALAPEAMRQAVVELGIARARLLGSAPGALTAAARAVVALEAGCSATDVHLGVVGSGASFVFLWSQASIGGHSVEGLLAQADLARLHARVGRLWPPGPETLGVAAARLVEGVARGSRRVYPTFVVLDGEFGMRRVVGTLPISVSRPGLVQVRIPSLNSRERVLLESALGV